MAEIVQQYNVVYNKIAVKIKETTAEPRDESRVSVRGPLGAIELGPSSIQRLHILMSGA